MDLVLAPDCRAYPSELRALPTAPVVYLRGQLTPRPRVAIVGSRRASPDALRLAERFARRCGSAGLSVVSGGALGVDGAAHRGALAGEGATLVVLPTALDSPGPRAHAELFDEILRDGGGWLTERASGPSPRGAFASRNRLIAALSEAVVVIQAGPRSGTLHTARAARRLGRRLFVLPWSILEARAHSSFQILRAGGAEVLTDFQDVIDAVRSPTLIRTTAGASARRPRRGGPSARSASAGGGDTRSSRPPPGNPVERGILDALRDGPRPAEQLSFTVDCPVNQVLIALARLELRGLVRAQPGGLFAREDH